MGYELQALLGEAGELRAWNRELPATVVCRLGGELCLVPMTWQFEKGLLAHTGESAAEKWAAEARLADAAPADRR